MKYLTFIRHAESFRESGPPQALMQAMVEFVQRSLRFGVLLDTGGLLPSRCGKRVRFSGEARTVSDGPFAEPREVVAGFWLWQVRSLEEAVEWVQRCPNPMPADSDIEIRPLDEAADFS